MVSAPISEVTSSVRDHCQRFLHGLGFRVVKAMGAAAARNAYLTQRDKEGFFLQAGPRSFVLPIDEEGRP